MVDFFTAFLGSCAVNSLLIAGLFLLKKGCGKWIEPLWQYRICLVMLFALLFPFFPSNLLLSSRQNTAIKQVHIEDTLGQVVQPKTALSSPAWIQDFTLTVNRTGYFYMLQVLFVLWFVGVCLCFIFLLKGWLQWRNVKKSFVPVENAELQQLWRQCLRQYSIKQEIPLLCSPVIKSPMLMGIWKPCVVLPGTFRQYTKEALTYVFFHELSHYCHKDLWMNMLQCILRPFYWFHPFVHRFFRELDTDREIACDDMVLAFLGESHRLSYGKTVLSFAEKMPVYSFSMEMGGGKKQLFKRIETIALFPKKTVAMKISSIVLFTLSVALMAGQLPRLSVWAYSTNIFSPKEPIAIQLEDLSHYFEGLDGTFVLYDVNEELFCIYNDKKSMERVSPQSTYKIYSALVGLETGAIEKDHSYMLWDGTVYTFEEWNRHQTLEMAMVNSTTWYFQRLDEISGKENIRFYIDDMAYGNRLVQGDITEFWLDGSLKISPLEQVLLLHRLYTNDLDFSTEHMETVKQTILLEQNGEYSLYGKTGTNLANGKKSSGWFIGYMETEGRCYVFATYLEGQSQASGSKAAEITLQILQDKQYSSSQFYTSRQ